MSNKSKLIIGISSRALFNLDKSHEIYEKEGLESYRDYQIANEDKTLEPGEAFGLVKKILGINSLYKDDNRITSILFSSLYKELIAKIFLTRPKASPGSSVLSSFAIW